MTTAPLPTLHLDSLERLAIDAALAETRGNRVRAARILGIHVRTLHRKLREQEAQVAAEEHGADERELAGV